MTYNQEFEKVDEFRISVPSPIVEKIGLKPRKKYRLEWGVLVNKTLTLKFIEK